MIGHSIMYHDDEPKVPLRCKDTPPSFSTMFSKGDNFCNFLSAFLEDEVFPKWGLLLKERIGANSFPYKMTPIYMRGKGK